MFLEAFVEAPVVWGRPRGPILSERARRLPEAEAGASRPLLSRVVEEIALNE